MPKPGDVPCAMTGDMVDTACKDTACQYRVLVPSMNNCLLCYLRDASNPDKPGMSIADVALCYRLPVSYVREQLSSAKLKVLRQMLLVGSPVLDDCLVCGGGLCRVLECSDVLDVNDALVESVVDATSVPFIHVASVLRSVRANKRSVARTFGVRYRPFRKLLGDERVVSAVDQYAAVHKDSGSVV
jgi:hypothetical protein